MDFEGGCQCGRVRFRAEGPPERSSVCYCRMCQKASGGPFMAFVRYALDKVTWTTPPDLFASSNVAERGFCKTCGTPLTYRRPGRPFASITMNSFDNPEALRPDLSFANEQKAGWLNALDSLPNEPSAFTPGADFVSHQCP